MKATALLDTSSSKRAVFISPSGLGNTMSNVEDFVLDAYKDKGLSYFLINQSNDVYFPDQKI